MILKDSKDSDEPIQSLELNDLSSAVIEDRLLLKEKELLEKEERLEKKEKELSLKDSIKIDVPETLNQFKKDLIAMHNLESN